MLSADSLAERRPKDTRRSTVLSQRVSPAGRLLIGTTTVTRLEMSGTTTHQHAARPLDLDLEAVPPAGLSPEAVRSQLARILASDTFVRSKGLCRFLQFAVEQKVRNQSVRLKEYLIGVTVFDRGESVQSRRRSHRSCAGAPPPGQTQSLLRDRRQRRSGAD